MPRVSAASVEAAVMELAAASPVRTAAAKFGRRVHSTLEGLKVPDQRRTLCMILIAFWSCKHHSQPAVGNPFQ